MIEPFLKWAGGKRWLVHSYRNLFPASYNKLVEPFLGSGAVFFALQPKDALLSDINNDLIGTYKSIQNDYRKVELLLKKHQSKHCKDYYYKIRSSKPLKAHTKASRFIYLNRTCWNGLYRVNQKGEFNVPIGTKSKVILPTDNFHEVSKRLNSATLNCCDFEETIDAADNNDFIFVDPPYTIQHSNNGFIKYNEVLFKWDDQVRLASSLHRAKDRGVKIFLTNANHSSIKQLYKRDFNIRTVKRFSVLAANSSFRKKFDELLITCNY